MANQNKEIKYLNRDFDSFKSRLIEFSKTYFPNTYNDFTPSSLGIMFMEQASYVGDVLSFYLDNQIQENFIQYTSQTNNLYELAHMFGYKPKTTGVAQVELEVFQQLPAKSGGGGIVPDFDYALTIPSLTSFTTDTGVNFIIENDIDFSVSSSSNPTEVTVYQISNNQPEYFLLKKTIKAISATRNSVSLNFGDPTPFQTKNITANNFIKIINAVDSNNNRWYEVDYLAQEMVYDKTKNTNINDPNSNEDIIDVPYILKLRKEPRRFATKILNNQSVQLQFGVGSPSDIEEEIIPNPNNVGVGLPFSQDKLTQAYSPQNFLYTQTYGISPSNTNITITYLTGGGISSNVASNTITRIPNTDNITFNKIGLNSSLSDYVFNSISVTNPQASSGGRNGDTPEEIRQNVLSKIASQNRSVTPEDYKIRALSMPSEYGAISKAYISRPQLTDNQVSTIETLNLWALTQNSQGNLTYPSDTLKKNLRTYLSQHRIIGDYVEIRNAYIINIKLNFEIVVLPDYSNNEILFNCITELQRYFNIDNWQINQPIFLRDLYIMLDKIKGVQTVKNITISNKAGSSQGYSEYSYDIEGATLNQVIYPSLDPSIFELRYPGIDIVGKVVPL